MEERVGGLVPVAFLEILVRWKRVITETYLFAVGGAEIETVGSLFVAQLLLLELHDLHHGLVHRLQHLGQGVLFVPGVLGAVVGEVCHEQRSGVFGVRTAQNIAIGIKTEQVRHIPTDIGEVGDGAVVHEDVAAKDERVAVYLRHDATASGTNVCE